LNFSHSTNLGLLEQRLLEGGAGLAVRFQKLFAALRYSIERELPPPSRAGLIERTLHIVSILPSVEWGTRFRLAAGANVGVSSAVGNLQTQTITSASLRPSVRVLGGLELAAEAAVRSAGPGNESLHALRGEVGYRFSSQVLLAAGYTVLGFSGLGVGSVNDRVDRVYLRAEVAH